MSRIEEEQKLERRRQSLHSHYQQYQVYVDRLDTENHFGEMQGKKFKRLNPMDSPLQALFHQSISNSR
jgi:hypothetical protein